MKGWPENWPCRAFLTKQEVGCNRSNLTTSPLTRRVSRRYQEGHQEVGNFGLSSIPGGVLNPLTPLLFSDGLATSHIVWGTLLKFPAILQFGCPRVFFFSHPCHMASLVCLGSREGAWRISIVSSGSQGPPKRHSISNPQDEGESVEWQPVFSSKLALKKLERLGASMYYIRSFLCVPIIGQHFLSLLNTP